MKTTAETILIEAIDNLTFIVEKHQLRLRELEDRLIRAEQRQQRDMKDQWTIINDLTKKAKP